MNDIKRAATNAYPGREASDEQCIAASKQFAAEYSTEQLTAIWEHGMTHKWNADITNFIAMELTHRLRRQVA